jgi:predicted phosphodiesterase
MPQLRPVLAQWPYVLEDKFEGVRALFLHYGLVPSGRDLVPVIKHATASDPDQVFLSRDAALIFYGHDHTASDTEGRARYVNPGSLGCSQRAIARYCIADIHRGKCAIAHRSVLYDDADVFTTFDRHFICQAFFGERFCT